MSPPCTKVTWSCHLHQPAPVSEKHPSPPSLRRRRGDFTVDRQCCARAPSEHRDKSPACSCYYGHLGRHQSIAHLQSRPPSVLSVPYLAADETAGSIPLGEHGRPGQTLRQVEMIVCGRATAARGRPGGGVQVMMTAPLYGPRDELARAVTK